MTQNINNAQAQKWIATFAGMEGLVFKLVAVTIPPIISGLTELGGSENIALQIPGDHVTFDDLAFDFIIDEDLSNYQNVYDWIFENTNTNQPVLRDCTIHFLTPEGKFRGLAMNFTNAYPLTLSGFALDTENATTNLISNTTIKFERIEFKRSETELI